MSKILITGGTGLIGKALQKTLVKKGHEIVVLTRNPKENHHFKWDISKGIIDEKAFDNVDYIIHLAGAGIADKKWTTARKKVLIDSRVESINLLYKYVQKLNIPLKKFISASGIGFYGAKTTETIFEEHYKPADDFIAEICIKWENAVKPFEQLNIPFTILRTGIVLSDKGGALAKMNTPLFLSALGSGKQYMPWIHIEDMINLYIKSIEELDFTGIFNAVAPEHQTNASFTATLGKVLKKPVTPFNVPSFVLKIILGELSNILLKGSRISSEKITSKYNFKYPNLKSSLQEIYLSSQ